jgi:hypothetical protein
MFVYALRRTGDVAGACLAGILFGFSPFMSARSVEHLSLIQAAPLPVFGLVMFRMSQHPTRRLSALAGLVVAWAFLCDPYYAVYCLMILSYVVAYSFVTVEFRPAPLRREWWTTLLDVSVLSVVGLIVGLVVSGGGQVHLLGVRVSIVSLYTPALVVTVLLGVRALLTLQPRLTWSTPSFSAVVQYLTPGTAVLIVALTPVLYALVASASSAFPGPGAIVWRNSPGGLDLVSYFAPNPFHPWFGSFTASWFARNGLTESVASIPLVALLTMAAATMVSRRWAPTGWVAFTLFFGLMSLGPFIVIGGLMTYIPGPWALARYLPIVGAARAPTRIAILALLGVAMLLAMAVQALRERVRWHRTLALTIGSLLFFELLPTPRTLYSAETPSFLRVVASDPRPVRVMNLPFGLRDGVSSAGNASAEYQFHQTVHEKPLVGGYISRLPIGEVERYRRFPVMSALMDLSEGRGLTSERRREVIQVAHSREGRLRIGWVVVDSRSASADLEEFAVDAFDLQLVATEGSWKLYRNTIDSTPTNESGNRDAS